MNDFTRCELVMWIFGMGKSDERSYIICECEMRPKYIHLIEQSANNQAHIIHRFDERYNSSWRGK